MVLSFVALGTVAAAADERISEVQVVRLPVPQDPAVSFRLWFAVGSQNDPPGKEGLAELTAAMLADASTQRNSYEKILDKLFPLAASYYASVSEEMTIVAGRVHRDNLETYYPLLIDAVLAPAFRQQDLDRLKSQALNHLENTLRYAGDEDLGKAVLQSRVFAGTRYAHIPTGRIETVRGIGLDDVRKFYRENFRRGNVVIGIGGGYDERLVDRLRSDLGRLPEGRPVQPPPPEPPPIRGLQVTIVEKDAPATAISIGFPISILRGPRAWYALAVANSYLGEHRNSSSHLYQVLREARGLNYGDYSYIEHFPNGSQLQMPPENVARRRQMFEIWIRPVPHEARHFALRAAIREFQQLADNGMRQADFDLTRNFLRKYVLHFAPTTMERLGYALDDRFYGIAGSHLEDLRRTMGELTLEEVNAAIKKHWQYANLQIVIVTKDAQALKKALVSNAPSPYAYPTPKPEAILAEDRQISTFPLTIKAENVTIVPVTELFVK
jgi:zinc protease